MSRNFVLSLAGIIVGCIGIGYAIANRQKDDSDSSEKIDEDQTMEVIDVVTTIVKEVKRRMTKKSDTAVEVLHFCKDVLDSRSYRVVVGVIVIGLGVGLGSSLIVSGYMPLPE